VTLLLLPRAQEIEKAFGLRSWATVLADASPTVVTYGRPMRWVLTRSALGPERAPLIARAILLSFGPASQRGWKPWRLRAYASYYATAELEPSTNKVTLGKPNVPALQATLEGPSIDFRTEAAVGAALAVLRHEEALLGQ
jgi:hypothetical protein